jgi:hypothetical protein
MQGPFYFCVRQWVRKRLDRMKASLAIRTPLIDNVAEINQSLRQLQKLLALRRRPQMSSHSRQIESDAWRKRGPQARRVRLLGG